MKWDNWLGVAIRMVVAVGILFWWIVPLAVYGNYWWFLGFSSIIITYPLIGWLIFRKTIDDPVPYYDDDAISDV